MRSGGVVSSEEPRRGRPRSEAAHRAVLDAAARLLDATPYEEITVEGIAAEAKVGKQTIYRWWPNKAAVVLEAILAGHARLELAPVPDTGDLRADLTAWMDTMVDEVFTDEAISMARSLLSALLHGTGGPQERVAASLAWLERPLTARLRAEIAGGRIRDDVEMGAVSAALFEPLVLRMVTTGHPGKGWARSLVVTVVDGLGRAV